MTTRITITIDHEEHHVTRTTRTLPTLAIVLATLAILVMAYVLLDRPTGQEQPTHAECVDQVVTYTEAVMHPADLTPTIRADISAVCTDHDEDGVAAINAIDTELDSR